MFAPGDSFAHLVRDATTPRLVRMKRLCEIPSRSGKPHGRARLCTLVGQCVVSAAT